MKNKQFKEQEGVTLIVLVITIIILVILASVGIYLTLGNNGVLTKAKNAKEQYEIAAAQEILELKIT